MQRLLILFILFFSLASTAGAQIGKSVSVAAGTDEDKALSEIYATPDGPAKIALLDKFMADYGKGDLELLGDQLYAQSYLSQKNYAKVYEYGEKALKLDPDNLSTVINLIHAAEEQADVQKIFSYGEKCAAIITRFKSAPPPEGTPPEQWPAQQKQTLIEAQPDIAYIQTTMVNAAFKTTAAAARAALCERYVAAFPDSPYAETVRDQIAFSYQQAQMNPKMLEAAQKNLEADPNDISMLVLLADYWSDSNQQLDKAAAFAQKALDALAKAQKPETVTDEQWQREVSIQKGLAYSALGQVDVIKTQNQQAVDAFKQASPLLKSDNFSYARNLYRLGFTLAKMQRTAEARVVLTEAVSLNTPYRARAQETLDKIGGAAKKSRRKSS
ncbi:MAG: tetratricopeptide repeat protein [Candidatus Acidiferrales bacterium]